MKRSNHGKLLHMRQKLLVLAPVIVPILLVTPLAAFANGAHGAGQRMSAPWWVWTIGLGILAITVYSFLTRARRGIATSGEFRGFSRNARLLLFQSPFSGFTVSLMQLLFNLYLLAMGFDVLFVASYVARNWTFHGLSVIPFGILADLFGRRRVYLVAYSGNILSTTTLLFTTDPNLILVLACVTGFFQGGHAITGPPFMREQSRPEERVPLFSLNGGLHVGSAGLGNIAAGVLPFAYAGIFGLGPQSATALRFSLLTAIPFMLCAMVPYVLIEEKWKVMDIRRWVKSLESYQRIGMLALTEGLVGSAMGLTTPFLNVFFHESVHASTDQIGLIFAGASILTAIATLFVPAIVQRLGRVRTITVIKILGIPCLIILGMTHNVLLAAVFYTLTILMIGGPFPNRGIADPIFSLFAMDVVKERERGTTNGIMHACVELPRGLGAIIAGPFMAAGNWQTPFTIGGGLFGLAFILYYLYFVRLDVREGGEPAVAKAPMVDLG